MAGGIGPLGRGMRLAEGRGLNACCGRQDAAGPTLHLRLDVPALATKA